jgi:hypothetical protein
MNGSDKFMIRDSTNHSCRSNEPGYFKITRNSCVTIHDGKEFSAMGEVIIELPFDVRRRFRIMNAKDAADVLEQLEDLEKKSTDAELQPVTDAEVLSVWANRTEQPDEIARQLRQGNRRHG